MLKHGHIIVECRVINSFNHCTVCNNRSGTALLTANMLGGAYNG